MRRVPDVAPQKTVHGALLALRFSWRSRAALPPVAAMKPTQEEREREPFRWCRWCDADCDLPEPDHAPECPSSTRVFPVELEAPNKPCVHCGWYEDPPMVCSECEAPLYLGDSYTHRELWPENALGATPFECAAGYEPICLGCAFHEEIAA